MNRLGADKSKWLWHLDVEKRCHGKDYEVICKDIPTTFIYSISCEHFLSSFKTNGENLEKRRRITSWEGVFLCSCSTFPPGVTLGLGLRPHGIPGLLMGGGVVIPNGHKPPTGHTGVVRLMSGKV